MKKIIAFSALLILVACNTWITVPPNYIAKILTPTGYTKEIYPPGQVDIGDKDSNGRGNSLVLIQRSGLEVKESFIEKDTDGQDHRCLTTDGNPVSLDVRFIFALPDVNTPAGIKDLDTLFLLGNPVIKTDRVFEITASSIYTQQAQQFVRGYIRRTVATYQNFNEMFKAFANGKLTEELTSKVAKILVDQGVTFRLVSVEVSNMKPDETVVRAQLAQMEAQARNISIDTITKFLAEDPTGMRAKVWEMQAIAEIVKTGNANNHNTIILTTGAAKLLGK